MMILLRFVHERAAQRLAEVKASLAAADCLRGVFIRACARIGVSGMGTKCSRLLRRFLFIANRGLIQILSPLCRCHNGQPIRQRLRHPLRVLSAADGKTGHIIAPRGHGQVTVAQVQAPADVV